MTPRLRTVFQQVLADNVLSSPMASALLLKLKAECEEQHRRALEAEAVSARLRDALQTLASRCRSDAFAHSIIAFYERRVGSNDGSEVALKAVYQWFANELDALVRAPRPKEE